MFSLLRIELVAPTSWVDGPLNALAAGRMRSAERDVPFADRAELTRVSGGIFVFDLRVGVLLGFGFRRIPCIDFRGHSQAIFSIQKPMGRDGYL